MGIQDNMTDEQKLEFRKKNRLCTFCEFGYYKFFKVWCEKKGTCNNLCPKDCPYYSPTLQSIDERSPR